MKKGGDPETRASLAPTTPSLPQSVGLPNVQAAINHRRNCSDLGSKLLLYSSQGMSVVVCYQVHCKAQVPKAARSSNAMQVRLAILWEVEIDNHIH